MPRQHTHHSRITYVFPDDFPRRLVRFKDESGLSADGGTGGGRNTPNEAQPSFTAQGETQPGRGVGVAGPAGHALERTGAPVVWKRRRPASPPSRGQPNQGHHSEEHRQRTRTHSYGNAGLLGGSPALQGRGGLRLRSPAARGPERETRRHLVRDETGAIREPHRLNHPGRVPLHHRQPGGFPRNRECSTSDAAHNPDVARPAHPRTRAPALRG